MKTLIPHLICGALLIPGLLQAQQAPPMAPVISPPAVATTPSLRPPPPSNPQLTKFDLDFPGGTPGELVQAIEKASGRPLNAIVPQESANLPLPALKMKNVDVAQLFNALQTVSEKRVAQITGANQGGFGGGRNYQYTMVTTYYTFLSPTKGSAIINDDTIWSFHSEQPTPTPNSLESAAPKQCRFFRLEPYLTTYGIDDITTALETGYKLLGESSPAMNYHKETKLLIVVGTSEQLSLVESLLQQLPPANNPEPTKLRRGKTAPSADPVPIGEK